MPETRQLVAIMFTDIEGYSALMGKDETAAYQLLKKNRKVQRSLIEKHSGKWLKEIGDGVMASFQTISDAVYCAIEIQQRCIEEPDLKLRIGIHQGEVIVEDGDVFGDGVNIASRLEPLAPAGGIYVSESVYRNIQNKKGIRAQFVREEILKNVDHPIKIYEIDIRASEVVISDVPLVEPSPKFKSGSSGWTKPLFIASLILLVLVVAYFAYINLDKEKDSADISVPVTKGKSIAVLPFVNMSNDPDQEYFSDGMMEEILMHLYKIGDLHVTSRTSAMRYKETNKLINEIANELGVKYILQGSVRKEGDKIKISVQLIDAVIDQLLWAESYDEDLKNVFTIQSDVAHEIARELKAEITQDVEKRIDTIPTENTEAYNLYLQGLYFWNKRNDEAIKKAIQLFEMSIKKDSLFAIAYSSLADAYNVSAVWRFLLPSEGYKKAKTAAIRALEINNSLGQAYAALAFEQMYYELNWEGANENFQKAIRLNPNYAPAHQWYSQLYDFTGNRVNALIEIQKALELDPLSLIINNGYGLHNLWNGNYKKAIEVSKNVQTIDPDFAPAHFVLYQCYYQLKELDLAFQHFKAWISTYGFDVRIIEKVYLDSGWHGMARKMLDLSLQNQNKSQIVTGRIAEYYVYLDEKEKALDYLEKAFEQRDSNIPYLKIDPLWFPLDDEPRFQKIIDKMDFPE